MDFGWIKNVCVIDSVHAFLQYSLLVSENELQHTFFFWGDGISSYIKEKFDGRSVSIKKQLKYSWYEILSQYPFLLKNDIHYWGHDHLPWSKYIIRRHDFELLEDGMMNYVPYPWRFKTTFKRRIFALWEGPLSCLDIPYSGYEKNCKKINLTGILDVGEVYSSPKVEVKSFQSLWNQCDSAKKTYINQLFDMDHVVYDRLINRKKILLTQPFSEYGILTEEEKIKVYSKVIESIGSDDVVIKIHPREKTNYKLYFPNIEIYDYPIPLQLILLNGIRFEEAYTIFSSAIFNFPYKIKVGFIGSQISKKLLQKFPDQTYKEYQNCKDMIDIKLEDLCD